VPIEDRIDLHAFLPKEIPDLLSDYLEEAVRAGFRQVRIIHGRGGGVQRARVRSFLSRHPLVEAIGDAPPEAGGWGATVARLASRGPISGK
jgi:DNA-nicking Smr family endonuclease